MRGEGGRRLQAKVNSIMRGIRFHTGTPATRNRRYAEYLDTLKQKLTLYAARIRRYRKSLRRKNDDRRFDRNERSFYRNLQTDSCKPEQGPTQASLEEYWGSLWSTPVQHCDQASWIEKGREYFRLIPEMEFECLSQECLQRVLGKAANWRAPGPDGIHGFWWKRVKSTHEFLKQCFNSFLDNPEEIPSFLSSGITYLKYKTGTPCDPANYRPITCLSAIYKVFTGCLAEYIYQFTDSNKLIAQVQKGCARGSYGCKELLVIDEVVTEHAIRKQRNLFMSYIDYKKAYDSVPHSWLLETLRLHRVAPRIVNVLRHTMARWQTRLIFGSSGEGATPLSIKRGIFQGDSLSPLWFVLAMNPLSRLLESSGYGYRLNPAEKSSSISHLLYMDDLKIYTSKSDHLEHQLNIVRSYSRDIHMSFGLDKCRTQTFVRGKIKPTACTLSDGINIEALATTDTYKYLGIAQAARLDHGSVKETLRTKFRERLNKVCGRELKSKNLCRAINSYCIPLLSYSFGIIRWSKTDLDALQRLVRVSLTAHRKHHPRSAKERLVLPRNRGGRGITDIGFHHERQIERLRSYFVRVEGDPLLESVVAADREYTPLNLSSVMDHTVETPEARVGRVFRDWKSKPLHGQFPMLMSAEGINRQASVLWLTDGALFPETEGFFTAIQDQVLPTRYYLKRIMRDPTIADELCRLCRRSPETIYHLISGCTSLSQTDYLARHDSVAKIVHAELAKRLEISYDGVPYYKYEPPAVLEGTVHTLYWNRAVLTDRRIVHNRPDIIWHDRSAKRVVLIDVAVPDTNNVAASYSEKIRKYQALAIEIRNQWSQVDLVTTVPIVISALGVIPETFLEGLGALGINAKVAKVIQRAVILGTCRIVRLVLGEGRMPD